MEHQESATAGAVTLPVWLVCMIRARTLRPTRTSTPCSRGGSRAASTRREPSCPRKQNWQTNSAASPTPPPGRCGHSNATGWPGGFSDEGTYRPDRMLIQASHDAPSRRLRPPATSAPAAVCISGLPPHSRADRNISRMQVSRDVRIMPRRVRSRQLHGDREPPQCQGIMNLTDLPSVPPHPVAPFPNATSALRRCASTRPSTGLTRASTRALHSLTSPMLAHAAVTSLFSSTKQAACHGRPRSRHWHFRQPGPITHRDLTRRSDTHTAEPTQN